MINGLAIDVTDEPIVSFVGNWRSITDFGGLVIEYGSYIVVNADTGYYPSVLKSSDEEEARVVYGNNEHITGPFQAGTIVLSNGEHYHDLRSLTDATVEADSISASGYSSIILWNSQD